MKMKFHPLREIAKFDRKILNSLVIRPITRRHYKKMKNKLITSTIDKSSQELDLIHSVLLSLQFEKHEWVIVSDLMPGKYSKQDKAIVFKNISRGCKFYIIPENFEYNKTISFVSPLVKNIELRLEAHTYILNFFKFFYSPFAISRSMNDPETANELFLNKWKYLIQFPKQPKFEELVEMIDYLFRNASISDFKFSSHTDYNEKNEISSILTILFNNKSLASSFKLKYC